MKLKEFRSLTKHLPGDFEIATGSDTTGGCNYIAYGQRINAGEVRFARDYTRTEESNMVILVSESDECDYQDD